MHVVSKLLAKNGEFVANYVRTPDVMSLLSDEQKRQYNIQLQTKSESQQLDEIQTACSDNGLNVTNICVILHTSRVNKYAIKCRIWNLEREKQSPKFWWALMRTYGIEFTILLTIIVFVECVIRISAPLLLGFVIDYFAGQTYLTFADACMSAAGMVFGTILSVVIISPCQIRIGQLAMRVRVAATTLMYHKFGISMGFLLAAPIQTIMVIGITWAYLGIPAVISLVLFVLYIPCQMFIGNRFKRIRAATSKLTDSRLGLMNEIIAGMRVIKMYTWEQWFIDLVNKARNMELDKIQKSYYLKAVNTITFMILTKIMLFFMFITFVMTGHTLTVRLVFVIMALFNILRLSVNQIFTHAINFGAESWVTCRRIEEFLLLDEMGDKKSNYEAKKHDHVYTYKSLNKARGRADFDQNFTLGRKTQLPAGIALPTNIMVKNIFAKWNKDNYKLTLDNISVEINPGDLLAVIGPVGSGKSSFLMLLLGELELMSGSIHINGTVSYSAQESWSFNNSVRNNILFGREYDERRYREVVRVCALERDLKILPFGDRTLMGENGVSVSGGQKARITLARSLYRNADICLMDDPLSAVDAAVAEHIFE
ncbi:unnamed protein product, partial [Medioppia subpectinata]